eukprot:TRINITY_DN2584_c0_g1_i3.p1 TRINITY_DN2584_c0_g1~~TRINITY_DN2584_c0_g1_i3.p1  ORF type:complete len:502 (+),score=74.50 TRINITY_DN2584_c0_g1_i3:978-2483(+)
MLSKILMIQAFFHILSASINKTAKRFECINIITGTNFNITQFGGERSGLSAFKADQLKFLPSVGPFTSETIKKIFEDFFGIEITQSMANRWSGRPRIVVEYLLPRFTSSIVQKKLATAEEAKRWLVKQESTWFETAIKDMTSNLQKYLEDASTRSERMDNLSRLLHDTIFSENRNRLTTQKYHFESIAALMDYGIAYVSVDSDGFAFQLLEPAIIRSLYQLKNRTEHLALYPLLLERIGQAEGRGEKSERICALLLALAMTQGRTITSWPVIAALAQNPGYEHLKYYSLEVESFGTSESFPDFLGGKHYERGCFPEENAGPDISLKCQRLPRSLTTLDEKVYKKLPETVGINGQIKDYLKGKLTSAQKLSANFTTYPQKFYKRGGNAFDAKKKQCLDAISKQFTIGLVVKFENDQQDISYEFSRYQNDSRFVLINIVAPADVASFNQNLEKIIRGDGLIAANSKVTMKTPKGEAMPSSKTTRLQQKNKNEEDTSEPMEIDQ